MQLTGLESADDHARSVHDNHARTTLRDYSRNEWNEPVALSQARDEALLAVAASIDRQAVALERIAAAAEMLITAMASTVDD